MSTSVDVNVVHTQQATTKHDTSKTWAGALVSIGGLLATLSMPAGSPLSKVFLIVAAAGTIMAAIGHSIISPASTTTYVQTALPAAQDLIAELRDAVSGIRSSIPAEAANAPSIPTQPTSAAPTGKTLT